VVITERRVPPREQAPREQDDLDVEREEAPACGTTRRSRESWRSWPSPSGHAAPVSARTGD